MSIGNNWEWKWLDLNEPYLNKSKHAAKKNYSCCTFSIKILMQFQSINKKRSKIMLLQFTLCNISEFTFLSANWFEVDWLIARTNDCRKDNLAHIEGNLTLIGTRSDTFISFFFLDHILSAEFYQKFLNIFGSENLHQSG